MQSASSSSGTLPDALACSPRLFIYELPDSYRHYGRITAGSVEGTTWLRSGDQFTATNLPYEFSGISMYEHGRLYYERALKYRCRVYDPAKADLFYVPAHNTEQQFRASSFCAEQPRGPAEHFNALFGRLQSQAPGALEALGGINHFVLSTRIGAPQYETNPFCELNLADYRLGSAARLSIEQRAMEEDLPPKGPFAYTASPEYISVPYPSWVRMNTTRLDSENSGLPIPWRDAHARSILAVGCFGTRAFNIRGPKGIGSVPHPLAALRIGLHRRCLAASSHASLPASLSGISVKCTFLKPNASVNFAKAAATLYWRSVFCLMPSGDSATRKATLDALLLGCIPVLFHRSQLNQWLWHWGGWVSNATVFIESQKVVDNITDPIEALAAIPVERVRLMQQTLAENAHRMHYAYGDGGNRTLQDGDAFDVTLRALHARASDGALIAKGKKTQMLSHQRIEPAFHTYRRLNETVQALDGQCKGSTGASSSRGACSPNTSEWAPWNTLRPLLRERVSSPEGCEKLCRRCARCNYVSYSWMMRVCTWAHACNTSRLDKRWELWTYRTWRVSSTSGVIHSR